MAQDRASFDEGRIREAIETARRHSQALHAENGSSPVLTDGALSVAAECVSVTVHNGEVCLSLPLGIGNVCLPVPSWVPDGEAAKACIDICTKWGVPCGVEVTVSIAGEKIVSKGFGCSC